MAETAPKPKPKASKRRWLKRCAIAGVVFGVLIIIVVGPWPVLNAPFRDSEYWRTTVQRLDDLQIAPKAPAPIRIGVAELDITPRVGHELAGYSSQPDERSIGVYGELYARALTIASDESRITILTADLLTMHPRVAQAVIERAGLTADDIYFSASHTHSGPGGWADGWHETWAIGTYDEAYLNTLVDQLAGVVLKSRESLTEVEVGVAVAHAPQFMRRRIEDHGETDERIIALIFREVGSGALEPTIRAMLVTYAAHATACGRDDLRLSPDYPGALAARLRETTGAKHVLFAAGAVGNAAPYPPNRTLGCESAKEMGEALADVLLPAIKAVRFKRDVVFDNERLMVELPRLRVPLTHSLATSPIIGSFFDAGESHIHVLRIGPVVMAGMPCDFSGGAALSFITWAEAHNLVAMPTSFNGDYQGYFVSQREFDACPKLEQRATILRGPQAGPYFADLAIRIGAQMTEAAAPSHASQQPSGD